MRRKADRLHAPWWFGNMRRSCEREQVSEIKKAIQIMMCAAMLVAGLGSVASAVNIDTVYVGNVGNVPDTEIMTDGTTGYGAVDYEYNIGKYEVTAGQYTEFLNAVAATDTYGLYDLIMAYGYRGRGCRIQRTGSDGSYSYSIAPERANHPVNYVNWGDAARFANWLHNGQPTGTQNASTTEDGAYHLNGARGNEALMAVSRKSDWKWAITNEDEWYKAAYHKNDGVTGNYFDYPTGSDTIDTGEANYNFNRNQSTRGAITVGAYPYPSCYGTFDQGGNVWEWTESASGLSRRVLRGGSVHDDHYFLLASYRYGNEYYPSHHDSTFGFRVSKVPEPATLGMLALGGLAMIRRRRRN
jgi:formylglycine-generating enzyme required for sulfatase activity